jgi:acyl transferase domain-containing protein
LKEKFSMEPIAIIGIGCRFQVPKTRNLFGICSRMVCINITDVPPNRWNKDALYDPTPATPGKMNTRWGAFYKR